MTVNGVQVFLRKTHLVDLQKACEARGFQIKGQRSVLEEKPVDRGAIKAIRNVEALGTEFSIALETDGAMNGSAQPQKIPYSVVFNAYTRIFGPGVGGDLELPFPFMSCSVQVSGLDRGTSLLNYHYQSKHHSASADNYSAMLEHYPLNSTVLVMLHPSGRQRALNDIGHAVPCKLEDVSHPKMVKLKPSKLLLKDDSVLVDFAKISPDRYVKCMLAAAAEVAGSIASLKGDAVLLKGIDGLEILLSQPELRAPGTVDSTFGPEFQAMRKSIGDILNRAREYRDEAVEMLDRNDALKLALSLVADKE